MSARAATLRETLGRLPGRDRWLIGGLIGAALAALLVAVALGAMTALIRAGAIDPSPDFGYRLMTGHGVVAFFYWLYFAQAAVLLAFATGGGAGRIALAPLAWLGGALMVAGLALAGYATIAGPPLLYDGAPEVVGDEPRAALPFYAGYLLLSAGLAGVAASAVATALAGKARTASAWSAVAFGTVAWAGLLLVSAVAAFNVFLPAAIWAAGWRAMPSNHTAGWHLLFHNMHYLPLMGSVVIWYAVMREVAGAASIVGPRFSKCMFALYLVLVPPTSLYHMFLEPDLPGTLRVAGSLLSLFIGVPTIAVFLIIVASLETHARTLGGRGLFGWLRVLPWREPALAAIGLASVNLALGGTFAFVLIQEQLAPLLSDTMFVPGYFHFLTVGTVTLTLFAALAGIIPAITRGAIRAPRALAGLPVLVSGGLLLFGAAGMLAGLSGMPRRVLDASYDGLAPESWERLSALLGLGGAVMAAGVAAHAALLLGSLLWPARAGAAPSPARPATEHPPAGQQAWTGPVAVMLLYGAMFAATAFAFSVMRGLPLAGPGTH
jgi:cytochrome c oxidase subunit 1